MSASFMQPEIQISLESLGSLLLNKPCLHNICMYVITDSLM